MSYSSWQHIDVQEITMESSNAFCCMIDGKEVWIPKAVISNARDYSRGDSQLTLSIKDWFAQNKKLGEYK